MIENLVTHSVALEKQLSKLPSLPLKDDSDRYKSSKIMCAIYFEHAESVKMLIASRNFTSSLSLVRLQYESLVRAIWLFYAATDASVSKLMSQLTTESSNKANKIPMLSEMLNNLEGKVPKQVLDMLLEFKEYSWKPLSSFVHGGIHAINRHSKGYPVPLLCQLLRASNGVLLMAGMLLIILHDDHKQQGRILKIQNEFADCLPEKKVV